MKKFLALLLVMVMCVGAGIGGTLAYLTDRDSEVNVFTVGNVDIELTENFSQGAELLPGVEIDKDVKIKNVGDNDAWVFYTYAVPANLAGAINVELDANGFDKKENITEKNVPDGYTTVAYLYKEVLKAGEEIAGPKSVTLSAKVDIDPDGNWNLVENGNATALNWNTETDGAPKMYVAAYAIQAEDFVDVKAAYNAYIGQWAQLNAEYDEAVLVATAEELSAALEAGESVALTADVELNDKSITIAEDAVLNLNGHTLSGKSTSETTSKLIEVKAGAELEITGEGTISFVAENPDLGTIPSYATNTITNEGTLVIGEGVVVTNGSEGGASYAVDNKGKFTLNGGTLIGDRCALRVAKYNQDNVESVMNGGLVKAKTPAWIQLPGSSSADAPTITVTINDGIFQSTKETSTDNNVLYTYSYGNSHENTSITINGGMFLGGTVSIGSGYYGDAPALTINGGTFEYDVLQWLESGYKVLYSASGIKSVSTTEKLDEAITSGASTVVLGSGNYIIPDSAKGKTLTIIGNGDTVVATQDDGSYEGCDYSLDGATVTFENVVINTDSSTYTGYARCNGTYNNCTINGTYTLYGNSVFNNCTFNVSGDVYNIWTWGAPTATFNNCTFNSDGKALLLYGTENTKLTVNGCTFNDNGGLTDLKAAIEIGNDYGKSYELIVNNTTVNGYEINDKGIITDTTLWGNKNSMGTDKLNVVVDGVDVY